ncbi:MAG: sigma 54-interacting transcriptional regulator [Deltaproteobacteria bacterium]|jgi:transcriptional regulator with GAF, ATPase, and Fis domain|nr:sigma 54-interacting transcriptional regulator [Deltaproteobacteria bacterium]
MSKVDGEELWPRLRDVLAAAVNGLQDARFIEETLEATCVQLGAASAWSTLETKGGGAMHRSRTASFRGVAPAVLALHVDDMLTRVQKEPRTLAGPVEYADEGSFAAVPLWSRPSRSAKGRSLVGALYVEFAGDQATEPLIVEFVESVAMLLGGMIAQQTLVEASREDLRIERAMGPSEPQLDFEELLAPRSMHAIAEELRGALTATTSVLLLGESGTGKTRVATAFARATRKEPVVRATLGMADDLNTITSELFGHERGAFSGAVSQRKGLVEYADGGTLILDEILNLPPHAQQLLLDFTQFGWYRPLGYQARDPKKASVRLISVTNGDIDRAVAEGRFRQDLYYRLATLPVVLPPLRERRWDIPDIAVGFLNRTDVKSDWALDDDAIDLLTSAELTWAGNIRELEAVMERARNRARGADLDASVIEARHLDLGQASPATTRTPKRAELAVPSIGAVRDRVREKWVQYVERRESLESLEREVIEEALAASDGIIAHAARLLSLPRTGLISRIGKLGIDPEKFRKFP